MTVTSDSLVDLAATRSRIEDWRAFLDDDDREIIRAAERTGRLP